MREGTRSEMDAATRSLVCPVSRALMVDPASYADGYSCERASIERWLATGTRARAR